MDTIEIDFVVNVVISRNTSLLLNVFGMLQRLHVRDLYTLLGTIVAYSSTVEVGIITSTNQTFEFLDDY